MTAVDYDEEQRQHRQRERATLSIALENMTSDRRESETMEVQQARRALANAGDFALRQTWWQYLTRAEDPLRAAITAAEDAARGPTGGKKTKKRKRNRKHRKSSKKNKKNSNKRSKKNKKNSKRNKRSRKK